MSKIKIGDVVECISRRTGLREYMYKYSIVLSIDQHRDIDGDVNYKYLGVPNKAPVSVYGQAVVSGKSANWRINAFKRVENPETLPCYKSLLLRGHSTT